MWCRVRVRVPASSQLGSGSVCIGNTLENINSRQAYVAQNLERVFLGLYCLAKNKSMSLLVNGKEKKSEHTQSYSYSFIDACV